MKTYITATFANEATIKTEMNATSREAIAYYYGKTFNLGDGKGGDNKQRCVSVFASPEPHIMCTFGDTLNQAKEAASKLVRI